MTSCANNDFRQLGESGGISTAQPPAEEADGADNAGKAEKTEEEAGK